MQDTGLLRLKNTEERANGTIPIMMSRETARELDVPLIDNWKNIVKKAGGATDEKLIHSGFIDPSGNHLTPKGARIIFEGINESKVIKTS